MKIAFCTAIAVAALGLSAGTASAQYVVPHRGHYHVAPVYPSYGYQTFSPGFSLNFGYSSPGLSVGGFYAPGGYSTYRPNYGGYGYPYGSYNRGYPGGHYHNGHYHR